MSREGFDTETIDPRFCTVQEWTDFMVFPLIEKAKVPFFNEDLPPRLDSADAWKEWAMNVVQSHNISKFNPPDPRLFDDWRDWAFHFIQVLS